MKLDDLELEVERIEVELRKLGDWIEEIDEELDLMDDRLSPYWSAKGDIEDAIRKTHGLADGGRLVFLPGGDGDRVPMFAALTGLAAEWGPLKTERAALKTCLAGYEREQRTLANELKRLRRKADKAGAKADTGQGGLFD